MTNDPMTFDRALLFVVIAILALGLVMVGSASINNAASQFDQPLHYFNRQTIYALIGLGVGWWVISVRLSFWQNIAPLLLVSGIVLLVLVLIPGIGREVNGSRRWLPLGPINVQVAELIKLFAIIYIADYLQRHHGQLKGSFFKMLSMFFTSLNIRIFVWICPFHFNVSSLHISKWH